MSAEDVLRGLDLPAGIAGCELLGGPGGTFGIRSTGPLVGRQETVFEPEGDTARIVGMEATGWVGSGSSEVPVDDHVDVFRELGFTRLILRSGKQYEIRDDRPGAGS
jgi:hypothetical protein